MLTDLTMLLAEVKAPTMWMPTGATADNRVDGLLYFIIWVCAFFLVFNAGLMIFFAIRYRQKNKQDTSHGHSHNTAMEVTWSVLPAFILAIIFIWGFRGYMAMATPPANSYDVMVTGRKWNWDFTYPNGQVAKDKALHVPAGQPIRLTLRSEDVIHSVFIPSMRVKKDVVPGRFNQLWFTAQLDSEKLQAVNATLKSGDQVEIHRNEYDLFCTEYCGQDHSKMITKIYVYSPEDFEKWLVSNGITDPKTPLVVLGKQIYEANCNSCHSLDGKKGTGPTWTDLYGATGHATSAGAVTVDDAYIVESIRNPGAKLADGFGNQMSSFNSLDDREVRALIEFMKTISEHAPADENLKYGDLNPDGTLKTEGGDAPEGSEGEESVEPQALLTR